jgi:hypothetical protein
VLDADWVLKVCDLCWNGHKRVVLNMVRHDKEHFILVWTQLIKVSPK